jgi:hypothetical protein
MQRVNTKFHARRGVRRDGDVIWRIPLRTGGEAYLLLMLEFQSTQDRWMALRVMTYAGLLWQHIVQEKRLTADGRLPPIFPVVLYNGGPRWAMPLSLAPLIGLPEGAPHWRWQPDMRYHIVDEGAFSDAELASRETLAALLFRLENAPEPEQIEAIVDAVIDWFRRHDGFAALRPLFAILAQRVVAHDGRNHPRGSGGREFIGGKGHAGEPTGRMEAALDPGGSPRRPARGAPRGRNGPIDTPARAPVRHASRHGQAPDCLGRCPGT